MESIKGMSGAGPEKIPVVILCGGLGMRIREETEFKPKPMLNVGGKPILWHIMKIYSHYGYRRFILPLGYKGDVIRNYFFNYRKLTGDLLIKMGEKEAVEYLSPNDIEGWEIIFSDTGHHTNTGGRIKRIEKFIDTERFMLTYGDGVTDLDIGKLLDFHIQTGRLATLTAFHPVSRFGVIEKGEGGRVLRFREKPKLNGIISGGFFILEKGVFEYLTGDCVFEKEPLERLSRDRQLSFYLHEGFWFSIDTYRDLIEINKKWEMGETPWKVW